MTKTTRRALRVAATIAAAILLWLFVWPASLGGSMTYITVAGPSMEPSYESGDFVIARSQDTYEVGDVIVYSTGQGLVIHRIVGGDGDSGYVTQGDNNPEVDAWMPTDEDVLGEAVVHVPGLGNAVLLVKQVLITPPFPYLLAGFVFLVIVLAPDKKRKALDGAEPEGTADEAEPKPLAAV